MQPGEYYILAIVITALFVAPFNALARVIVLSWLIARGMWMLGLPEQWANLAGQACVMIVGAKHLRTAPSLLAWALSVPLLVVNSAWLTGIVEPATAWWATLFTAMAQLLLLPLAIDTATLRSVTRAWHDTSDGSMFMVGKRA